MQTKLELQRPKAIITYMHIYTCVIEVLLYMTLCELHGFPYILVDTTVYVQCPIRPLSLSITMSLPLVISVNISHKEVHGMEVGDFIKGFHHLNGHLISMYQESQC